MNEPLRSDQATTDAALQVIDRTFPRRRCSAGGLIFDPAGSLLLVKPSYRDDWLLPGGIVEAGETPAQAVVRETREEAGLAVSVTALLAIDSLAAAGGFGESIHFLFLCEARAGEAALRPVADGTEIIEARFVPALEAMPLLAPSIRRRLQAVLAGEAGYFEDGVPTVDFRTFDGRASSSHARDAASQFPKD